MDWVLIGFKLTVGYMLFGLAFSAVLVIGLGIWFAGMAVKDWLRNQQSHP